MERACLIRAVVAVALAPFAASAEAQDASRAPDVREMDARTTARDVLPLAPRDYVTERVGRVEWVYPAQARSEVHDLKETYRAQWARVMRELGGRAPSDVVIRVGRNPEEMRRLAPRDMPPPPYAIGVAYPSLGVVLLTLSAPDSWERPDMDGVLVHELSHVALYRATGGARLPRWFVEGVAIHQAGEHSLARTRTLWEGTVRGQLIPLPRLSRAFPSKPHAVNLAYAQSADIVAFMRRGDDDAERFRELLTEIRAGAPFGDAVRSSYYVSIGYLEREWRGELHDRYTVLPLVLSGGGLWVLAAGLIVFAYFRRKRAQRETLKRWAEEEAARDRAEKALAARIHGETTAPSQPRLHFVPLQDPEPGVPTIEYEGRSHTLH